VDDHQCGKVTKIERTRGVSYYVALPFSLKKNLKTKEEL
jgi:hypothetical protein